MELTKSEYRLALLQKNPLTAAIQLELLRMIARNRAAEGDV